MFKFAHNNLNVLDLERSLKFYREALDLTEISRLEFEDFILVYLGDSFKSQHQLELQWFKNRQTPYNLGENKFHLAFTVKDFDAAYQRHKKLNCICNDVKDLGIYFISDPDGYLLEVLPENWGKDF
ncbi:MAG: VOC family protein [Selenomonadaceae bacterium]|nr:VOC family protein [Selenomonadaceae bacterium]